MGRGGSGKGGGMPNAATENYVSGEGMWINQYLRGRGDFGELSEDEKRYLSDLDKATAKKIGETTLYRSVDADAIFGDMSQGTYDYLRDILIYGQGSLGKGEYAAKITKQINDLIARTEGKTITEKGFMSTTTDPDIAEDWGSFTGGERPVVMRIQTGKNTKGVNLSDYDRNADEPQKERLLARNQSYKVKRIYTKNKRIYVDVEMR